MKKILSLILALIFILSIVGCSNSKKEETKENAAKVATVSREDFEKSYNRIKDYRNRDLAELVLAYGYAKQPNKGELEFLKSEANIRALESVVDYRMLKLLEREDFYKTRLFQAVKTAMKNRCIENRTQLFQKLGYKDINIIANEQTYMDGSFFNKQYKAGLEEGKYFTQILKIVCKTKEGRQIEDVVIVVNKGFAPIMDIYPGRQIVRYDK